jgi:hypothetical protein
VQDIELILLIALAVGAALLTVRLSRRLSHDAQVWTAVIIGVLAGIIGLALVVVPDIDTVPDDTEGILFSVVVIAITLALGVGTVYRFTQR